MMVHWVDTDLEQNKNEKIHDSYYHGCLNTKWEYMTKILKILIPNLETISFKWFKHKL